MTVNDQNSFNNLQPGKLMGQIDRINGRRDESNLRCKIDELV